MRERGRNYLLSACSASRYKLRTPSSLYLIIHWPRNLWIFPACSLPFSTELCPSLTHLFPSLPQMAPKSNDSRFPSAPPQQAFSKTPLPRGTPRPPPGWPCGVCLFPPISLHLCIWSLTQGLTPHVILSCAEHILPANDLQHMLRLLFFLLWAWFRKWMFITWPKEFHPPLENCVGENTNGRRVMSSGLQPNVWSCFKKPFHSPFIVYGKLCTLLWSLALSKGSGDK